MSILNIRYVPLISLFWSNILLLSSCDDRKKIYTSDCDADQTFKRVSYNNLVDSIAYYDQQYVEITGRYQEGKNKSVLYNPGSNLNGDSRMALWVNFSPECPLYLTGAHSGFFEYEGKFSRINNKILRIRGKIDMHNQGPGRQYKGCIDDISFIEL